MKLLTLSIALVTLAACESTTRSSVDIELGAGVAASFSAEAPGVLVVSPEHGWHEPVLNLCGDEPEQPIDFVQDYGFGCLADDVRGTESTVSAWIEPLPAGWDAAAFCALERSNSWDDLDIGDEVTGDSEAFARDLLVIEAAEDWAQGTGVGEWKRDLSPCGGSARVDVLVE